MDQHKIDFASAGRTFSGVLFEPLGHQRRASGVLVLHGGAGPGAHEEERARRLAELGYVAFVPDLFGEVFTSREHGVGVITKLVEDPTELRRRLADALARLRSHPQIDPARVAAIGFCFGGLAALELARSGADIRAAVSLHGGLSARAPAEPDAVKASILVCTGAADPFVPHAQRDAFEDEMTRANADWQLHVYANAMHGFTEENGAPRPGVRYQGAADRRSWQSTCALLEETLR